MNLETDKCIYVGQTIDLKSRKYSHCNGKRFGSLPIMFCVIRTELSDSAAARIEGQIIRAYRKRGEAMENKVLDPRPVRGCSDAEKVVRLAMREPKPKPVWIREVRKLEPARARR